MCSASKVGHMVDGLRVVKSSRVAVAEWAGVDPELVLSRTVAGDPSVVEVGEMVTGSAIVDGHNIVDNSAAELGKLAVEAVAWVSY